MKAPWSLANVLAKLDEWANSSAMTFSSEIARKMAEGLRYAPINFDSLRTANETRQAEWDKKRKITLSYRGNELAGETGEACNVIKKLERERMGMLGSQDSVAHLAEELADVVICVDLICLAEGIDLAAAVRAKFNKTSEKVGLKTRL